MTDRYRLTGKRAIVTGGSSGIGAEVVRRLTLEGARVCFCARSQPTGSSAEDTAGAEFLSCDVTQASDVDRFVQEAAAELGGIDVVVTCAGGTTGFSQWPAHPDEEWSTTMNLNVGGTFLVCRSAWPHLERSGKASVVMISSLSAQMAIGSSQLEAMGGGQPPAAYQASKAAVDGLMVHLAGRGGERGIRVNSIRPGRILTDKMQTLFGGDPESTLFWSHYRNAQILPRHGTPADIANAVVFLGSDESSFITGQVVKVDGGAIAHL